MNKKLIQWGSGWCFVGLLGCGVLTVQAQEICGNIISQVFGGELVVPVTDCDDPFMQFDGRDVSNVQFKIDEAELFSGDVISVESFPAALNIQVTYDGDLGRINEFLRLYKHESGDFIRGSADVAPDAGTYTLVHSIEESPQLAAFLPRFREWIVPTAHAQSFNVQILERTAVTFTVALAEPQLVGAPSVLFLPGIQASRLYKEGIFSEDKLWTPTNAFSQDVRQLEMTNEGRSVNEIYTRDVLDEAPGVGTVYGEFISYMKSLESEGVISAFEPFAYDWRFTPNDIVNRGTAYEMGAIDLVKVFDVLAEESNGAGVVIVGHSNGGLVAKALVAELEQRGKADGVSDIVFIGTPHTGTPKAIGTVLHGYDQAKTLLGIPIIQADVVREVINNLPGAYGLLPTPAYFADLTDPIIQIEDTASTIELFEGYGSTIDTYADLVEFMSGQSDSLDRELSNTVSVPATINQALYTKAVDEHINLLSDWVAPEHVQVTQLVGVGLPTMKSITYREVIERKCITTGPGGTACGNNTFPRAFAILSHDGDETVMSRSARAYAGDSEVYYVDMENVEELSISFFSHVNLTEAEEIQQLIKNLIEGEVQPYEYVSTEKPVFDTEYDIEIIDSPVTMSAIDELGNVTGVVEENGKQVIKTDIPGSNYFEFADSKYLIIPSQTPRTTTLRGDAEGGYTLTLATLDTDDQMKTNSQLVNATVTPNMIVTYTKHSSGYSNLATDFDGDGELDLVTTVTGEVVEDPTPEPEPVATYDRLRSQITALDLPRRADRHLSRLVDRAERAALRSGKKRVFIKIERWYLSAINRTLRYYQRIDLIERSDRQEIRATIKEIRKN